MHEFALAEAVYDAAIENVRQQGLVDVRRIVVRIGQLQRIVPDVFRFALEQVLPGREPELRGVTVEIETEPALFHCRPCGREFSLDEVDGPLGHDEHESIHFVPELAHAFMGCPSCQSPDFEVRQGRGVSIAEIEGSTP